MTDAVKGWLRENHTLVVFLVAQLVAVGALAASGLAYFTKLETRVSIMETRGAEYTVDRMNKIDQRITVLEQGIKQNSAQLERIVDAMTSGLKK